MMVSGRALTGGLHMIRKGDRVVFKQRAASGDVEIKYGIVSKGGSGKIKVVMDGGQFEVSGPAHIFTPSDKPLPNADEVNPMREYSIKSYKEIEGHGDSPTFSAKICKNGKPIIGATNDGWGGPNMYYTLKKGEHQTQSPVMKQFEKDLAEWLRAATGIEDQHEIGGLWIEWEMFVRPYGVSAKEHLQWLVDMLKGA
jgi:hypothetical protein